MRYAKLPVALISGTAAADITLAEAAAAAACSVEVEDEEDAGPTVALREELIMFE